MTLLHNGGHLELLDQLFPSKCVLFHLIWTKFEQDTSCPLIFPRIFRIFLIEKK
jgi:hypothetical protein